MTLVEVARRAGVSPSTVSRVLNNTGRVSERTRARVLKIAKELKYRPDIHAQTLAGGNSKTLGVIFSNLQNPFFLDIVNRLMPYYWMRLLGGSLYLIGMLMFVFNLLKTIAGSGQAVSREAPTPAPAA